MRVVVDTNVFIGACIGRGASSRLIEACFTGSLQPVVGAALLYESRDVVSRDAIFGRARLNSHERGVLLRAFVSRCVWQSVHFKLRPNLRDEADNHIVELAFAADARIIVTSNVRDFTQPEIRLPHMEILTPKDLLERIQQ